MTFNDLTFDKLDEIPYRTKEHKNEFDSVLIVPMGTLHDSGFMNIMYLFCDGFEIVCKSGGSSDVLHINGIGGYGDWKEITDSPDYIKPQLWSIDCTQNGFIRLFTPCAKLSDGGGCSDHEVFYKEVNNAN